MDCSLGPELEAIRAETQRLCADFDDDSWGAKADFEVRRKATNPAGRDRVRRQVESCPRAVAFGHNICAKHRSAAWAGGTEFEID